MFTLSYIKVTTGKYRFLSGLIRLTLSKNWFLSIFFTTIEQKITLLYKYYSSPPNARSLQPEVTLI